MLSFIIWYVLISVIGLAAFPLVWRLFPALADRGYAFARAFGLLLWAFVFWILASLGFIQNNAGGLALSFFILLVMSALALWKAMDARASMPWDWLRLNRRMVITTEILFFLAFAGWAFIRACNPEITSAGGEKTMEVAFINAIMRSPTFPPHDPWLSGYAISYYYFGYVMTAMLAEVSGVAGSVAHNLMLALVFALSAIGAYGILYNLLAVGGGNKPARDLRSLTSLPILGPIFLLIVSNLEGFLEVLHANGIFWPAKAGAFNFWIRLDIPELNQVPAQTAVWPPRFYWWWRASRVITDFDLSGAAHEIIDEFPFFSYLLGDLHPHVLAMPFVLLAVSMALNIFLGGWDGDGKLLGFSLKIRWSGILIAALVLGGLAFLNTWDILALTILVLGVFLARRILLQGWNWVRLEEALILALPLATLSILLYLPFYLGFSTQAGGILPNLVSPTRGIQLWVMFAALFVPMFVLLFHLLCGRGRSILRVLMGLGLSLALILLLWGASWLLGWVAWLRYPDTARAYLQVQDVATPAALFFAASRERLMNLGGTLTLFLLIGLSLAYLFRRQSTTSIDFDEEPPQPQKEFQPFFVVLLILLGALLVLAPEFVFIRDNFGNRMNTVFKFYYEGWEFWSLAAAFAVALLWQRLTGFRAWLFTVGISLLLAAALVYPVLGTWDKTAGFRFSEFRQSYALASAAGDPAPLAKAAGVWTLDGAIQFERDYPLDALAVRWLQTAAPGVVAEAVGPDNASYQDFAHISTYSGLPTVMGWVGHEGQWRGSYTGFSERELDVRDLYETNSWEDANAVLEKYAIRYVFIGTLERRTYRVNETKFQQHLQPVFLDGDVVIYAVP